MATIISHPPNMVSLTAYLEQGNPQEFHCKICGKTLKLLVSLENILSNLVVAYVFLTLLARDIKEEGENNERKYRFSCFFPLPFFPQEMEKN